MPLYKLIGGYRDSVRAYATAAWAIPDIDAYKRQADEVLSLGFTAYKMTAWGDPSYDIKLMREMRRHVGDDIDLMLDCVSAYDHRTALKVGRVAEELDFYWFEEPLWDHDIHGLVKLCSALDIPVVSTETLPGANYTIAEYIIRGAADIVRSDVMWKGGVTSTQKTIHLADCFGMNCEVHTSQYSLTDVANLHLVCSAKNCDFYELLFPLEFYSDYGVLNPVRVASDGTVSAPQRPGWGSRSTGNSSSGRACSSCRPNTRPSGCAPDECFGPTLQRPLERVEHRPLGDEAASITLASGTRDKRRRRPAMATDDPDGHRQAAQACGID